MDLSAHIPPHTRGARDRFHERNERRALAKQALLKERNELVMPKRVYYVRGTDHAIIEWPDEHLTLTVVIP